MPADAPTGAPLVPSPQPSPAAESDDPVPAGEMHSPAGVRLRGGLILAGCVAAMVVAWSGPSL